MGGTGSEEFMVKSDAGEDTVAYCEHCGYAANVEVAVSNSETKLRDTTGEEIREIFTPGVKSIDELCNFLSIGETQCANPECISTKASRYWFLCSATTKLTRPSLKNSWRNDTPRPPGRAKRNYRCRCRLNRALLALMKKLLPT